MSGHWLADRVAELAAHPGTRTVASPEDRRALTVRLEQLCQELMQRPGVVGVVGVFEGLPLSGAGSEPLEALAALVQRALLPGDRAFWETLGDCQQVLLIGSRRKLAVLALDQVAIGILSDARVRMTEALG